MPSWPGNPVAVMRAYGINSRRHPPFVSPVYNTGCEIVPTFASPVSGEVNDQSIDFEVKCEFVNDVDLWGGPNTSPLISGQTYGHFYARFSRQRPDGSWEDRAPLTLVLTAPDGTDPVSTASFVVTFKMDANVLAEHYKVELHCSNSTSNYNSGLWEDWAFSIAPRYALSTIDILVTRTAFLGDFELDFTPISIVYCPPDQDMTNSLTQSRTFGTRFTLGMNSGLRSDVGVTLAYDFLGILGQAFGLGDSASISNQSQSGIQISHTQNTVVTADNQRAIGRAYWGPLGDLFVIVVKPSFGVTRRSDESIFCSLRAIGQVVVVPAWKLLRPGDDPIASSIPADARRRILATDPFVTNLDPFFPDSGRPLSEAVNPYQDPSANNRSELIARWWLDGGAEINYSQGEVYHLSSVQTDQFNYESTATIHSSVSADYNSIKVALGVDEKHLTTVGYQRSQEAEVGAMGNVACSLIRNQNERDTDGIELYVDKVYSTLMFRRVRSMPANVKHGAYLGREKTAGYGAIVGTVAGWQKTPLRGLQVQLSDATGAKVQTSADSKGRFFFYNLDATQYTLVAGDKQIAVIIKPDCGPAHPERIDLSNVRRPIDFTQSAVWEIADALAIPVASVRKVSQKLSGIRSDRALATLMKVDSKTIETWKRGVVFGWAPISKPTSKRLGSTKGAGQRSRRAPSA